LGRVLLEEEVRMGEIVRVHFQQRAPLEDERWKDDFREVHSDLHLREEVTNDRAVALDLHVELVVVLVQGYGWDQLRK
jgi:aminoglycoside phosphotransferase family enzyme